MKISINRLTDPVTRSLDVDGDNFLTEVIYIYLCNFLTEVIYIYLCNFLNRGNIFICVTFLTEVNYLFKTFFKLTFETMIFNAAMYCPTDRQRIALEMLVRYSFC